MTARVNLPKSPRRSKYAAEPVYVTPAGEYVGRSHPGPKTKVADSRREFKRFLELTAAARAGRIQGLRWQSVTFRLHGPGGSVLTRYRPDAVYVERGRRVVEDVKGHRTRAYKLKRKWMKDEYGIEVREV